jgi:hypothetical protein
MLKLYGEPALDEGAARVEEFARAGEDNRGSRVAPDQGRGHPARQYDLPPGQLHSPADNRVYRVSGVQRGNRSRMTAFVTNRTSTGFSTRTAPDSVDP